MNYCVTPGYRDNVAAVVFNKKGTVFLGKKCYSPLDSGTWQFPQGGVDRDEQRREALLRELKEELGLHKNDFLIVSSMPQSLKYKIPQDIAGEFLKQGCIGQEQNWFLIYVDDESKVDVRLYGQEFVDSCWVSLKEVLYLELPTFKIAVYKKVLDWVGPVIKDFLDGRSR